MGKLAHRQVELPADTQITSSFKVWEISTWCWSGFVTEGGLSASRSWLRRFLLLKQVTVLLFPHGAVIPLLVGCMFSIRALLLLHSSHISTKPSTVFLSQLALSDSLVLLQWTLQLGGTLAGWMEEVGSELEMGLTKERESLRWREAVSGLCQQLLDAHHLASLLLLWLLGLEATLVSRWPQQTRRFRTSHWAQFSCSLVWMLVLLELVLSLHSKLMQDSRPQTFSSTLQNSKISYVGFMPLPSMFAFSPCQILWLVNLWLHYVVFHSKPQRKRTSYH